MQVRRIAAFSCGNTGGNPAGVVIAPELPSSQDMQRIAAEVGYAETVFAAETSDGFRVRYFAPESEIPFCGHATIALGAALAMERGSGTFKLEINAGQISVQGGKQGDLYAASFLSPPTRHQPLTSQEFEEACELFSLRHEDVDPEFRPVRMHAGADHLALFLRDRARLAAMQYSFSDGQRIARARGWVTMMLAVAEAPNTFYARHAFAFGGMYEDPATGAGAAALAGYMRDVGRLPGGEINVCQGDDMGVPCRLNGSAQAEPGSAVRVSGTTRLIEPSAS